MNTKTEMLNPFPIQFLAPIAYFMLRICVGAILLRLGIRHLKHQSFLKDNSTIVFFPFPRAIVILLGITEIVVGTLFILGLYTQIAALIGMGLAVKIICMHRHFKHPLIPSRMFYTLLFFASFSLFITGAGILAFDLPI